MTNWTRELWQFSNRDFRGEEHPHNWYVTGDHDGECCVGIATVHGNATAGTIPENNARRIVACVNACAGIPAEALEAGVVEKLSRSLESLLAWCKSQCLHIDIAQAQMFVDARDALTLLEKRS